jgi:hypothetical protein
MQEHANTMCWQLAHMVLSALYSTNASCPTATLDFSDGLQILGIAYTYNMYSLATDITPNGGYGFFLQNHYHAVQPCVLPNSFRL